MTITETKRQRNRELLAEQHEDVQDAAKDIRQTLQDVERYLFWSMDPEEKDGGAYHCRQLLDTAHQLVDQAHAYRAALKVAPKGHDQ
jgi:hypothetical protein